MTAPENPADDIDLKTHLRDHVSASDFAKLQTHVEWIVWLARIAIGAAIVRWLLSFLEAS